MIHFNETVGHKPGKIRKMLKKNKIGNLIRNSNSELFIKITVPAASRRDIKQQIGVVLFCSSRIETTFGVRHFLIGAVIII